MNALVLYRASHRCQRFPILSAALDRLNTLLTGCTIAGAATIAPTAQLEYGGKGVHIGPLVVIGAHAHLAPFVRLEGEAVIRDYASIGPGCHLKGPVTVQRYQEVHLSQLAAY